MEAQMAKSSVRRIVALLLAVSVVGSGPLPAHARSDAMGTTAVPRGLDQTVYRPNCPRAEYDGQCLRDGCAMDCRAR